MIYVVLTALGDGIISCADEHDTNVRYNCQPLLRNLDECAVAEEKGMGDKPKRNRQKEKEDGGYYLVRDLISHLPNRPIGYYLPGSAAPHYPLVESRLPATVAREDADIDQRC